MCAVVWASIVHPKLDVTEVLQVAVAVCTHASTESRAADRQTTCFIEISILIRMMNLRAGREGMPRASALRSCPSICVVLQLSCDTDSIPSVTADRSCCVRLWIGQFRGRDISDRLINATHSEHGQVSANIFADGDTIQIKCPADLSSSLTH